jgi:hypothetical protein
MAETVKIEGGGDGILIAGGFVIFLIIISLVVWALNPDMFKKKEGDKCEVEDGDIRGTYEIDDKGKCVLKSCDSGWKVLGDKCTRVQPPDAPAPGTPSIAPGTPSIAPGTPSPGTPTTAVINSNGQGKTAGVTYTCPAGQVSGCNVNGQGVGDANSEACVPGSYIYCVPTSGTPSPGTPGPSGTPSPGTPDSDGFISPGDLSGVNLIADEKQGVTPKNALKSGLLYWRPDSNFGANGQTNPYDTTHFKKDDHTDFKRHAINFIPVTGIPDTYNLQSVSTGKYFTYSGNRTWKTTQTIPAGDTSYNVLFKKGPNTGIIRMSVILNGSRIYFWLGDNWKLDGSDNNPNIKGIHIIDVVETTLGSNFRLVDNTFYACDGGAIGCNEGSVGVGDFTKPRCVTDAYMYCRKPVNKGADDKWTKKVGEDYTCTDTTYNTVGCDYTEANGKENIGMNPLDDTKCPIGSSMYCYASDKQNIDRTAAQTWRKRPGEKYSCVSPEKPDVACNNESGTPVNPNDDSVCPMGSYMYCYWDVNERDFKKVDRTAEQTWRKQLDEEYTCVSPKAPDIGCNNDQVPGWSTMTEVEKAPYYGVPLDNVNCPQNAYMYCYWDKNKRGDVIPKVADDTWRKEAGKTYKCISDSKPTIGCNNSTTGESHGGDGYKDNNACPVGSYMYCYKEQNSTPSGRGAAGVGGLGSDRRLKDDITRIGTYKGYNVYKWVWNEVATSTYGYSGSEIGFLADEIESKYIGTDSYGYKYIKEGTQVMGYLREVRNNPGLRR